MENSGNLRVLLLRPFYGITVHGDMHGDFGISDHQPHIYPDLSFVHAATILHQAIGDNLHIVDANLDRLLPRQVVEVLRDRYDLILLKAAGPTIQCDIDFAKALKALRPESRLAMAGHAASFLSDWIRTNLPEVDEVVDGPLEDFAYRMVHGDGPFGIDDFPCPDFTLFNYEKFRDIDGHLRLCLSTSRGCPVGCQYCPYAEFYGGSIEVRSLGKVMGDIDQLAGLGIDMVIFRDQYFTFNRQRTLQFCEMMKQRGAKLAWQCETRLESTTAEMIDAMVDCGLEFVSFGVEAQAPIELKHYNRPPVDEAKLAPLIARLHARGVTTLAFYIVGFPGDHWNRAMNTYRLALRLGSKIAKFSIFEPCTHRMLKGRDAVPAMFTPFCNTMGVNVCRSLTRKEVEFLSEQLTTLYHLELSRRESDENNYIKGVYDYHVLPMIHYKELVAELQGRLKRGTILDLAVRKDARRKIRVY